MTLIHKVVATRNRVLLPDYETIIKSQAEHLVKRLTTAKTNSSKADRKEALDRTARIINRLSDSKDYRHEWNYSTKNFYGQSTWTHVVTTRHSDISDLTLLVNDDSNWTSESNWRGHIRGGLFKHLSDERQFFIGFLEHVNKIGQLKGLAT